MKTYQALAQQLARKERATDSQITDDCDRKILDLMITAPHGSRPARGQTGPDTSTPNKLVFSADFHHRNDAGMYDGWTSHQATATPDFTCGFTLRISGRNKNGIKAHIEDTLAFWLDSEAP